MEQVVNSLSLALTEWTKELDIIIGVNARSQLYFLTNVLNGNQFMELGARHCIYVVSISGSGSLYDLTGLSLYALSQSETHLSG